MRPGWENECVSKSALIEWLRPYLHTGEPIPADVLISDIQMMPPTLTPQNEPLTIEELRKMDGEPVWGKSLITDKPGEWFIVRIVVMSKAWFIACAGATQGFGDKDTYGTTWLAYRRPPEGEEDT